MLKNFLSGSTKPFLFILIIIIFAAVFIYILIPKRSPSNPPTPVQIFSPLQKTSPGKTVKSAVEKFPGLINIQNLFDGSIQYNFSSSIPQRPNTVIAKNDIVTFEQTILPEDPQVKGYAKISDFTKMLGEPEKILQGSRFYGHFISTYIYSSKGLVFIGNSFTDEVYEIQTFSPSTPADYINTYGTDISQTTPQPETPIEK